LDCQLIKMEGSQEFERHKNDWERRWNAYGRIRWDGLSIQENVRRVFNAESPKQMAQPKERLRFRLRQTDGFRIGYWNGSGGVSETLSGVDGKAIMPYNKR